MNNDMNIANDTVQAPITVQSTKKSKLPLLAVVFLILTVAVGAGGYLYGKSSSGNSSTHIGTVPADWQPLPSNKKGFPMETKDNTNTVLTYYSLDEGKVITLDSIKLSKNSNNGSMGRGKGAPIASPDLTHIAYLGDDNNLWLFSVETQRTKQLTSNGLASLITDWSPDSKNILYYYERKTIANSSGGIDAPAPTSVSFKPQIEQGFYQTNIETGKVIPLAAVEASEGYIDNNTLLVKVDPDGTNLAAFTIDKLQADLRTIQLSASFGIAQFSFSPDGKKWAYLNPTSKTDATKGQIQVVFGDFPKATTVIDAGGWADVQWPLFSTDNKKIAYQKRVGMVDGMPQEEVWTYHIASGARKKAGEGSLVRWLDEKTILARTAWTKDSQSYLLINTETGEVKTI